MFIPDTSVHDTHFGALTKVAKVMELAHSGGVVNVILNRSGVITKGFVVKWLQVDMVVGPDSNNIRELLEAVQIVRVGHNACAREDLRLEGCDDFDIFRDQPATTDFGGALWV